MAAKKAGDSFAQYEDLIVDPVASAKAFGYWPTGSPRVDRLLGGGLTKGRLSEWYGREQSGKSTLALKAASEVIKLGGKVLYIDLERGLEIRDRNTGSWLEVNGINPFDGSFSVVQAKGKEPLHGERIYELMIASVREHRHQLIILDSMAALVTRGEFSGEIGDSHFGAVAKLNSQALKILFGLQGVNPETHILILNQVRDQIAGGMGGLKSTGGKALPHYVHTKMRFEKRSRATPTKDGDFLTEIRLRLDKARGVPAWETTLTISAKRGIDVLTEIFETAMEGGYIERSGAWYTVRPTPGSAEVLTKVQGDVAVKEYLQKNSEYYASLYRFAQSAATLTEVDDE